MRDFGTLPGAPAEPAPAPMNGTDKRNIIERPRARREAAKVLALAMQSRYRRLLEATGEDEIVMATGDLAQVMYENVEFTIWALKSVAGLNPPPPEALRPISKHVPPPANDPRFAKPPAFELAGDTLPSKCTCPPLEAGIIGRDRHMTSCPKFKP